MSEPNRPLILVECPHCGNKERELQPWDRGGDLIECRQCRKHYLIHRTDPDARGFGRPEDLIVRTTAVPTPTSTDEDAFHERADPDELPPAA